MNKSLLTNIVSLALVVLGFLLPGLAGELVLSTGLFAVSGAVTNWLAVHMLFERVPGFYGSGVIPARFTEFKAGIRTLVMQQFFNPQNVQQFFSMLDAGKPGSSVLDDVLAKVDFNQAFDGLVEVIKQSSFGGMLGMLGGAEALKPLRAPFVGKMQEFLHKIGEDGEVLGQLGAHNSAALLQRVEAIVDKRLEELTPQLVKDIIQQMIREHLGWLVVWGGVVGGLLGLVVAIAGHLSL
jgi:uncharacterized membrane protein YheB (UPF0754 family)